MTSHQQEWFNEILNTSWVLLGPNQLVQPKRDENGIWTIGNITTDDEAIYKSCPDDNIQNISEFYLIHHDWQVAILKRYKPAIYFCAFGNEAILQYVQLAVNSLIQFGKWQHDIIIFTGLETKENLISKLAPFNLGGKLHIIDIMPADKPLDWYTARYRIDACPLLQQAQPILYLDVDFLCDGPLDSLFIQLIDSPYIHACKEGVIGEGSPNSEGHWYGWRLMQADHVPFNPDERGFSSGALFYKNFQLAAPFFKMILQSAYGYIQKQKDKLVSYDQRFANYILYKYKKVEIHYLAQYLRLYRIPENTTQTPDINDRLGLVHFLGATLENKLLTMQDYFSQLNARITSSSQHNISKISTMIV
ncbi:glycosyltransferase [Commensalibacter oyaizuii]|uniref:Glycosyltransferase n=1 Tax=Commensalibacter oyaizuii TaxID=3043873 RepID=A0ABT6Q004_9PROT|nr:glycosyltransferase [Commensalibacter sp. TBRC 16381]MDI2089819.1 glycosyltransferase [Commensalibacter sp. TBRC 16381]